jgi:hypothetical protein
VIIDGELEGRYEDNKIYAVTHRGNETADRIKHGDSLFIYEHGVAKFVPGFYNVIFEKAPSEKDIGKAVYLGRNGLATFGTSRRRNHNIVKLGFLRNHRGSSNIINSGFIYWNPRFIARNG